MNRLICILILLAGSSGLFGQNVFTVGLTGGITATQYDGDNYAGYNKLGFQAGGFTRMNLAKSWSFQFEILYFQKGARRNPDPSKSQYNQYALDLDYACVPMLIQLHFKGFYFETGVDLGFKVREKEVVNYVDITGQRNFKPVDLMFAAGLSYKTNGRIEFNLRYGYSIFPVRPHASGATYWFNQGEYNNVLGLSLRYRFGEREEDK